MKNNTIYMTKADAQHLQELLDNESERASNQFEENNLRELETGLNQSTLVDPDDVPRDIITMNSVVALLDLETEEEMICKLVFPDDADIDQNKISVLAPVGTAMLGRGVGDTFEWQVPAGLSRFEVKEILS
jgi:regulator of nucleoside diphosphate kinase